MPKYKIDDLVVVTFDKEVEGLYLVEKVATGGSFQYPEYFLRCQYLLDGTPGNSAFDFSLSEVFIDGLALDYLHKAIPEAHNTEIRLERIRAQLECGCTKCGCEEK